MSIFGIFRSSQRRRPVSKARPVRARLSVEILEERTLLSPPDGTWSALEPMLYKRQEMSTAVLNGEIYVIGGYDENGNSTTTVQVYNPATDTWRSAAPLPLATNHGGAAVAAGTLYAFGGTSNRVFAYDPVPDAWSEASPMQFTHWAAAVAVINDQIYVAGGNGEGMQGNEVEVYNPSADMWTTVSPMNVPRNHSAGAAIDGKFYVVGGRDSAETVSYSVLEVYDPSTDTWTRLADMPTARSGLAAAAVNGYLYTFGGELPRLFGDVEVYDPLTDSWRRLAPMPTPRHGIFAAVIGNAVYLPGGAIEQGFGATDVNEVFVADPAVLRTEERRVANVAQSAALWFGRWGGAEDPADRRLFPWPDREMISQAVRYSGAGADRVSNLFLSESLLSTGSWELW